MALAEQKVGLEAVGIDGSARVHWSPSPASLYEEAVRRREGMIAAEGRSCAARASTPAARPTTSSSSRSRRARSTSRGARSIARSTPRRSTGSSAACWRTCGARSCSSRTAGPAPIRRTGCRFASSPRSAWHSLFARHMFIPETDPAKLRDHEPQFTVIDVPSFTADPADDKTNSEVVHPAQLRQAPRAHRRHELRGRDQEVDLHRHELPAAAARRHADALLGEHRPGRRRRALLRPLGHRQDDALERSPTGSSSATTSTAGAARGVFNFEGGCYAKMIRLSAGSRAADLRDDAPVRHGARERRVRSRSRARSISTTTRSPRTRAARIRCRSSTTRCRPARAGIRRTS